MLQTLIQDYFQSCVRKMHVIASVYFANHQLVNVAKSPKTFGTWTQKGEYGANHGLRTVTRGGLGRVS